jgi:hypothetical protein
MKRKERDPSQPTGRRVVYDPYADEMTRPDIVPAALRFAEDSEPSSGFEHRRQELPAYSDWYSTRESRDEPTVADVPLPRSPRVPSEAHAQSAPAVPRSGPRHRAVATTPPTGMPKPILEPAPSAGSRREERRRRRELDHALESSMPVVRERNNLMVLFLVSLATAVAVVLAMSLRDGSLKRVFGRSVEPHSQREVTSPRPSSETRVQPRAVVPSPNLRPAPSLEASEVPVVRIEDLPLSKPDGRPTKTRRTGGARRSVFARPEPAR